MFKNPIKKYQSGGKATPQEQQQIAQLFEAASKNTGIAVETLMEAANQLQDENQMKQYVEAISLAAQGDQTAINSIKQMFTKSASQFAKGGKLHDFICKHTKGGHVAGCGCKEDGGRVSKAQNGTSGIPQNASALDTYLMSNMQMPTSDNLFTGQQVANLINSIHLNQPIVQAQEDGGKVEKNQKGKIINSKTRTIAKVDDGMSKRDAEELGIDPNTLANTGVTITAYPNKKPYVVDGMLPFFNRNGIAFQSGGIESSSVEDGSRLSSPAIPGRKYKVSTIGGQDYYANPDAMRYPVIVRYASPVDTIYNLGFQTYGSDSPAYSGIRDMYNSAIHHPNTFAWDKDSYTELQRQKNEKKENGGKVVKNQEPAGPIGEVPQYRMVQDTSFLNPAKQPVRQIVIVDNNGQGYRKSIGNDGSSVIGGYWNNNKFYPEGDVAMPVEQFDSLLTISKKPQQKTISAGTKKQENGGRFKSPLSTKKSKGAVK